MKQPSAILYFPSTHWDREWYKTVDEFRFHLVPVMKKIITTLENCDDFSIFTLDGQTCVLNDYLLVASDDMDRLKTLIQNQKLLIGPWYTMPDEFLVSCESLIQNLKKGFATASSYGSAPMKCGYVCDIFGHIANLPQILNGFQIRSALISRGTNDSSLECFFNWTSPDGSSVLTYKAPETCGYGSFFYECISEFAPDYTAHLDEITQRAIAYTERELTRTALPFVILMDSMDHETIHEFMPEILRRLSDHYGCPVLQKSLEDMPDWIQQACCCDVSVLPQVSGELNEHAKANVMHNKLIPHTLSSRYDIKQANQNLLEYYAMPSAALNLMENGDYLRGFLPYAYELLLQNHAHDSICGCSIDAVHREMLIRFEKVQRTAAEYFQQFAARQYQTVYQKDGDLQIYVYNPLPYEYNGLLELDIDFPVDFAIRQLPYIKFEQRNSFLIQNEQGETLPYNLVSAIRNHQTRLFGGNKQFTDTHRIAVTVVLRPMGYTVFSIIPFPRPYRIMDRFSDGQNSCENAWIRFSVESDGTITIFDKETDQTYSGLHSFLDCGEMGDGWFHIRPIQDSLISSIGCPVRIEKTFDGCASCKFSVHYYFSLPQQKEISHEYTFRSENTKILEIVSTFTISRTSKLITVDTIIRNNIQDHRLQLHLPVDLAYPADEQPGANRRHYYYVNQCNAIIRRSSGTDLSHYDWKEADISEYPMENMAFVREENPGGTVRGLLFLSKGGLHEISCPGDRRTSMDITLLRCFRQTVGTDGEPDGQLQKKLDFHYAFMPLNRESNADLVQIKDTYISGYESFTVKAGELSANPPDSALQWHSDSVKYITCMPADSAGILIRAANYSKAPAAASVQFAKPVADACLCNFLEQKTDDVKISGNTITFTAAPCSIVTLHVQFNR